jgi:hypothetical protein
MKRKRTKRRSFETGEVERQFNLGALREGGK